MCRQTNPQLASLLWLTGRLSRRGRDLVPIISALEYNTWFTKLRISHLRLSHEAAERLLHVLKKSVSLEEVYLDNTGMKA